MLIWSLVRMPKQSCYFTNFTYSVLYKYNYYDSNIKLRTTDNHAMKHVSYYDKIYLRAKHAADNFPIRIKRIAIIRYSESDSID